MASSSVPGSGSAGDHRADWNRARNGGRSSAVACSQQYGKDRQALRVVLGGQVPNQRNLHFGADPAPHAVPSHQQHEGGTAPQGVLQAGHPAVAGADRIVVLENAQASVFQRQTQRDGRLPVRTAVAEKYLLGVESCGLRHGGEVIRVF